MSGLAEILVGLGFVVSGSDLKDSSVCERLRSLGVQIAIGHCRENLPLDASLLVYSSAVAQNNPEVLEAQERGLPIVARAEVLAELMRLKFGISVAGSHGKTTSTSFIASALELAGLDPTVIIGGRVKALSSGGKLGKGDFLVAESDESDRSFLLLKPSIAVLTNIDAEHMGAYESFEELVESFATFINSVPFYGLSIFCSDDVRVRKLYELSRKRKVCFGLNRFKVSFTNEDLVTNDERLPDFFADNITIDRHFSCYDLMVRGSFVQRVKLNIPGRHFVSNSLAAFAVADEIGVPLEVVAQALAQFRGVARRLEVLLEKDNLAIITDYGHHPSEIAATLKAIRDGWCNEGRRVIVVFQPHRYTRTRDCLRDFAGCFKDADSLILTPIYSAGEAEIPGISSASIAEVADHLRITLVPELAAVGEVIKNVLKSGDIVVFLGAGSIDQMARGLALELGLEIKGHKEVGSVEATQAMRIG